MFFCTFTELCNHRKSIFEHLHHTCPQPNQTKPDQTKPDQTKPNQTRPNQTLLPLVIPYFPSNHESTICLQTCLLWIVLITGIIQYDNMWPFVTSPFSIMF